LHAQKICGAEGISSILDPGGITGRPGSTDGRYIPVEAESDETESLLLSGDIGHNVGGDREAWLRDVEELTAEFRRNRARKLRWRGHEIESGVHGRAYCDRVRKARDGESSWCAPELPDPHGTDGPPDNPYRARWHYARARGELERFDRVRECGCTDTIVAWCPDCGVAHERATTCGATLVCAPCRGRIIRKFRLRFLRAREVAVSSAGARMRGIGAWTDKLLTLTAPHVGAVEERVAWVRRAIVRFRRWWSDHIPHIATDKRRRGLVWDGRCKWCNVRFHWKTPPICAKQSAGSPDARCEATGWRSPMPHECGPVAWTRVFEWTQGSDGLGHPHVHMWALSPWVPRDEISVAWHRALIASEPPEPIDPSKLLGVDIQFKSAEAVARELIKYLTKDLEYRKGRYGAPSMALVRPAVYATVYKVFVGTRRVQSSRGFMRAATVRRCLDCGSPRKRATEIRRGNARPGLARAPPRSVAR